MPRKIKIEPEPEGAEEVETQEEAQEEEEILTTKLKRLLTENNKNH